VERREQVASSEKKNSRAFDCAPQFYARAIKEEQERNVKMKDFTLKKK
jgi:hypothetical protein